MHRAAGGAFPIPCITRGRRSALPSASRYTGGAVRIPCIACPSQLSHRRACLLQPFFLILSVAETPLHVVLDICSVDGRIRSKKSADEIPLWFIQGRSSRARR